jgi:hypothetical protein
MAALGIAKSVTECRVMAEERRFHLSTVFIEAELLAQGAQRSIVNHCRHLSMTAFRFLDYGKTAQSFRK